MRPSDVDQLEYEVGRFMFSIYRRHRTIGAANMASYQERKELEKIFNDFREVAGFVRNKEERR